MPTGQPKLRVIGDISCDIDGAIECTVKATEPGEPNFVYNPLTGEVSDGVAGEGVVVMAVDILPSELPRDASEYFSRVLLPYVPALASADYSSALRRPGPAGRDQARRHRPPRRADAQLPVPATTSAAAVK